MISETDIWVVGQFYKKSLIEGGNDSIFNAMHWNGIDWSFKIIPVVDASNTVDKDIYCIYYVDKEVWVMVSGGGYARRKNGVWTSKYVSGMGASNNKIWGSSSSDLYFVGYNGNITHYDGTTFKKMTSGTTVELKDVYGTPDGNEVWACGWNSDDGNSVILRKTDNNWNKIVELISPDFNSPPYYSNISTLWTNGSGEFLITGIPDGIVRHSTSDVNKAKTDQFSRKNFAYRIRGNADNNIFLAGDGGMIWHYNGKSWKYYQDLFQVDRRLYSISVEEKVVVAVGRYYRDILSNALVITGKRQ